MNSNFSLLFTEMVHFPVEYFIIKIKVFKLLYEKKDESVYQYNNIEEPSKLIICHLYQEAKI